MKKLLIGALLALSATAQAATMLPSTMINWISVPTWPSVSAGTVFAGPVSTSGAPAFRAIVATDLPVIPVSKGGTNAMVAGGTALDNITGFAGTGFVKRTGAGAYAFVADPLPIANGGTGAASASAARTALGAAASGANTDITSLNAPALGAATATTAAAGTNTTQVATTAFAQNAVTGGGNAGKFTTLTTTAMSRVAASTTNAQSIPNNTFTQLTTYTASLNQGSNFTASTGNYVTPAAGLYDVRAGVRYSAAAGAVGAQVVIAVFVNGSEIAQSGMVQQTTSSYASQSQGAWIVNCAAGDTITIRVFQNSGAAMTLDGNAAANFLQIVQLP
ncbi:hypothetical protein [Burkholderia dolosa]|uniref:hypothetical protein n=1 Tax=Burkholderia dolosa TaxID=152500 RepID=UPI002012A6BB|nr:hypothetical protein [Burkholderia dolosa]